MISMGHREPLTIMTLERPVVNHRYCSLLFRLMICWQIAHHCPINIMINKAPLLHHHDDQPSRVAFLSYLSRGVHIFHSARAAFDVRPTLTSKDSAPNRIANDTVQAEDKMTFTPGKWYVLHSQETKQHHPLTNSTVQSGDKKHHPLTNNTA